MSNGLNRPSLRSQSRDALSRISDLEKQVDDLQESLDQAKKGMQGNFKLYADLFNRLAETLVNVDDKLFAFTELVDKLVGTNNQNNQENQLDTVQTIVQNRVNERKDRQDEQARKRQEQELKFIETGVAAGYLKPSTVVSQNSLLVGTQYSSQGNVVGPDRQQFFINQVNEQVQLLFIGKNVTDTVALAEGETFKMTELFDLDIELYKQAMEAQQASMNQAMQAVQQANTDSTTSADTATQDTTSNLSLVTDDSSTNEETANV